MLDGMGAAARIGRVVAVSLFFAAMIVAGLGTRAPAAQSPGDAGTFLSDLSKEAMVQLTEPGLSEDEKQRRFRALLNQGFDVEAIARFVLGRYWRQASESERRDFLKVFEDSMVFRFLPILGDYTGDVLQVGNVRPFGQTRDMYSVESELLRREGPPVRVDWRIHKGAAGYQVLDILAEGVSVAVTLRAEYSSVLKQNGGSVAALSQALRDKIAGL